MSILMDRLSMRLRSMHSRSTTLWVLMALGSLLALWTVRPAVGAAIQFDIDTSAYSGQSAFLALDFIDGGPPTNTITITSFTTDGTLGTTSTIGDVTGTLPGSLTLQDTSFFNEYLQALTLGSFVRFVVADTGNAPLAGSFADGFSAFLLDASGIISLVPTTDPTGAGALLLLSLGAPSTLETYASIVSSGPVAAVPEPSTMLLLSLGLLALTPAVRRARVASGRLA